MAIRESDLWRLLSIILLMLPSTAAQEAHNHGMPERLGKVSFPTSCIPAVQEKFDRGVALLHSFAYSAAENTFQEIAQLDPQCAMAHWGMAIAYFHQLWDPPIAAAAIPIAQKEIRKAQQMAAGTERERQFIHALGVIYENAETVPYLTRVSNYDHAMSELATANKKDLESQVFYALALLANASPADKTHAKQKQAADLLEPLDRAYPQHPGIPHYLIHAYDNAELAARGLAAARVIRRLQPQHHTPCTCRRIYSLASDCGRIPSLPTLRREKPPTSKGTLEKNCMPWIIWCMPICKVDTRKKQPK